MQHHFHFCILKLPWMSLNIASKIMTRKSISNSCYLIWLVKFIESLGRTEGVKWFLAQFHKKNSDKDQEPIFGVLGHDHHCNARRLPRCFSPRNEGESFWSSHEYCWKRSQMWFKTSWVAAAAAARVFKKRIRQWKSRWMMAPWKLKIKEAD